VPPHLTAIVGFPVKSLQGVPVDTARVEPWGLAGDRRWMVVDEAGETVTARFVNAMLLLRPRLVEHGLTITDPDGDVLQVAQPVGHSVPVTVHHKPMLAVPAGPVADAWLTRVLGRRVRLMYLDDPTLRPTNPTFSSPEDRVSFADGYPLMVTTESSLTALDELVAAGPHPDQAPLGMTRFRPNLVVSGTPAWSEDGWRRIRIGASVFRAVKGCERCVMTTVNPDTAQRSKEPIATLARYRRFGRTTWFGMNLIPDTPGSLVHVGDDVEILESVEAPDGPPR
jgi:uncharacterized protein YcbX